MLENSALIFIPLVNPDGVQYIETTWKNTQKFEYIRKNRNIYDGMQQCTAEYQGVDLNRNYDYMFAHDSYGSSDSKCGEDYHGPHAFSEPETQAIRDFVTSLPNLRIALNLHAWGPLFIQPYNWDDSKNANLESGAKKFYDDVFKNAGVPNGYTQGNGAKTIGYTANGEASDWMLHERGIYALSPELGIKSRATEHFFIKDEDALFDLLRYNYDWIEYTT